MAELFTLPTPKRFEATCRTHELKEVQVSELKRVLWRTHLKFSSNSDPDIDGDQRKLILKKVKRVQNSLDELLSVLGVKPGDSEQFEARHSRKPETEAGRKILSKLMAATAGREKVKNDRVREVMPFLAYGLEGFGDELLKVKETLDLIVDVTVKDKGGRPADLVKNYLASALCESFPGIMGGKATFSAGGKFVKLVRDVFEDCGLSDEGIEKLVERTVKSSNESK